MGFWDSWTAAYQRWVLQRRIQQSSDLLWPFLSPITRNYSPNFWARLNESKEGICTDPVTAIANMITELAKAFQAVMAATPDAQKAQIAQWYVEDVSAIRKFFKIGV